MPRIRTIKPGFWDSPDVAEASAVARLTYIAMWCWADDYGVGTANLKELEGFVFPHDDVEELTHGNARNFRDVVAEVADVFGVEFYKVRGRPYYAIPSWDEHQKIERRAKTRNPTPDDADEPLTWGKSGDTEMHGSSASLARKSADVQAPEGEREEEEEGEEDLSRTGSAGTHETAPDDAVLLEPTEAGPSVDDLFARFWDIYPRRADKKKAREAFGRALKRADAETILRGAADYRGDPNRDDGFTKYPATWLNADAWENDPLPARTQGTNAQDRRSEQIVDLVARNLPGHDAQRGELEA